MPSGAVIGVGRAVSEALREPADGGLMSVDFQHSRAREELSNGTSVVTSFLVVSVAVVASFGVVMVGGTLVICACRAILAHFGGA